MSAVRERPSSHRLDRSQDDGTHRRSRHPVTKRFSELDTKYSPYLYILPFFVVFLAFFLYPLGYMGWVSLNDWELIGTHHFVGLKNYSQLLADSDFWNATKNTLAMFVISAVPQMLMALGLAHLLNRKLRARTWMRMGILLPNVTSVAAVALIFGQLFGRDYGLINWAFHSHLDWQTHQWSAWTVISIMVDWRWTGYNALIFLGAMQSISGDLYEAASIDGASQWTQFWRITIPMLRPALIFVVIISTIGSIQLFTEPLMWDNTQNANGGAGREYQTLAMFLYQKAFFGSYKAGYGAAIAWMMFLLIIIVAAINYLVLQRPERRGRR